MVEIIRDGPWAHEEVWECWQEDSTCVVQPASYPDPSRYLKRYQGPPGLFQYVINEAGGFDLKCMPWELLQQRFEHAVTPKKDWDVTWAIVDNSPGYGLVFGRLYPMWLQATIVPFTGQIPLKQTIDEWRVTTIVADGNALAAFVGQDRPEKKTLRRVVSICRGLTPSKIQALEHFFEVPIFTAYGAAETGIVAWGDAKKLLRRDMGKLLVPYKMHEGDVWVKPGAPWGETDAEGYMRLPIKAEVVDDNLRDLEM